MSDASNGPVKADDEILKFIVQESDKRISAQVQVMLSTDSRSNTLLSTSIALAVAAFGVSASQYPTQGFSPLVVGAIALAMTSIAASVSAITALWPAGLDIQGWSPILFENDLAQRKSLQMILEEIKKHNQDKINSNVESNKKISSRVKRTMLLLALSPLIAGVTAFITALMKN